VAKYAHEILSKDKDGRKQLYEKLDYQQIKQ